MEEIVYSLNLDLRKNTHQVLVMKEDDVNSRVIEAVITDNGKPYDLTNCAVNLKWKKPDGHIVYADTERVDDSTVKVICTDQMLAVAGTAEAEFDITSTTAVASTLKFMVSINETVISNSDIESSDEFGALQDIMGHISNESIHVPSGGTSGQVLTMGNDGKSTWSDSKTVNIIDNLKSTDKTAALSANQGYVLSNKISGYAKKLNPEMSGSMYHGRVSNTYNIGSYSFTWGSGNNKASAKNSFALGESNISCSVGSFSVGSGNTAGRNTSDNYYSIAMGYKNSSRGCYSVAIGDSNEVTGTGILIGSGNSSEDSYVFGSNNVLTGGLMALGKNNEIDDSSGGSIAYGYLNIISNSQQSHSLGYVNKIYNSHYSVALGSENELNEFYIEFNGITTISSGKDGILGCENKINGGDSYVLGSRNEIYGTSCVVGYKNSINYILDNDTGIISINDNHVFGEGNNISGSYNYAMGTNNEVYGTSNYSYGTYNTIKGAKIEETNAYNMCRNAITVGKYLIASSNNQFVQGFYNTEDTEGKYAYIFGGGTGTSARKNLYTLDWDGNAVFAGDITFSGGKSVSDIANDVVSLTDNVTDLTNNLSGLKIVKMTKGVKYLFGYDLGRNVLFISTHPTEKYCGMWIACLIHETDDSLYSYSLNKICGGDSSAFMWFCDTSTSASNASGASLLYTTPDDVNPVVFAINLNG